MEGQDELCRYPSGTVKESWYTNRLYQILFHQVPAHGVDLLCKIVGKKPFLTRFVLLWWAANYQTEDTVANYHPPPPF